MPEDNRLVYELWPDFFRDISSEGIIAEPRMLGSKLAVRYTSQVLKMRRAALTVDLNDYTPPFLDTTLPCSGSLRRILY